MSETEIFDEVLTGSAATAVAVAIVRAEESLKPDRLYEDPWAATFVARAQRAFEAAPGGADSWRVLTEMTRAGNPYRASVVRVLDDVVTGFVAGGCGQLVVPGAGLDIRSIRLAWPGPVTVYELDVPAMIAFRQSVLGDVPASDGVTRVPVAADLARGDWGERLIDAGFDPGRSSAWVLEAVLTYVERSAARALMARITELAAPGSRLAQQYTSPAAVAAGTSTALRARIARVPGVGRFIPGGQTHLGPDAESFLSGLGWKLEYRQGSVDFARIGRPLPPEEVTDLLVGTRAATASG